MNISDTRKSERYNLMNMGKWITTAIHVIINLWKQQNMQQRCMYFGINPFIFIPLIVTFVMLFYWPIWYRLRHRPCSVLDTTHHQMKYNKFFTINLWITFIYYLLHIIINFETCCIFNRFVFLSNCKRVHLIKCVLFLNKYSAYVGNFINVR